MLHGITWGEKIATEGCGSPEGQMGGVEGLQGLHGPERASARLAQTASAVSSSSAPPSPPPLRDAIARRNSLSLRPLHQASLPSWLVL